jgi:hypothetical protein
VASNYRRRGRFRSAALANHGCTATTSRAVVVDACRSNAAVARVGSGGDIYRGLERDGAACDLTAFAMSSTGLPIGVQLVAAYGRDDLLLRVGSAMEADIRWDVRRAPVHASTEA